MNTYHASNENATNSDNHNIVSSVQAEDDFMMPGGFDDFEASSYGNVENLPLGSVDYSYINQKYKTNPCAYKVLLTRKQQVIHAFNPFQYHCYNNMTIEQAKEFINWFSKLYIGVAYLGTMFLILVNPDVIMLALSNPFMSAEYLQNIEFIIAITIGYLIAAALAPIWYRISAFLLRLIGSLVCLIFGKNISDKNMYLVSVYALVPFMILRLIPGFCPFIVLNIILRTSLPLIGLVAAIINMCIGVACTWCDGRI